VVVGIASTVAGRRLHRTRAPTGPPTGSAARPIGTCVPLVRFALIGVVSTDDAFLRE
jgi:hypothetical protein